MIEDHNNFGLLQKKIKYNFRSIELLKNVFIHRSYLNEHKNLHLNSNEKLEFLGDSVLSLITSLYLFKKYPHLQEGDYTDIKASIVRTESLAEAAESIQLGNHLFLSRGQDQENGRKNINILADCFEALIASVFLDGGFEQADAFVNEFLFSDKLDYLVKNKLYLSPKSRLQEYTQSRYKVIPVYKTVDEKGPEHEKTFKIQVFVKNKKGAIGVGKSKKEAEELAAKKTLEKIENII
ncbi:ribonuclease III [Candidatus Roizmanbacteria bacterium]|jgi:ribonuclease-3|nr:ribonuclease III [Candidatus Roizmanbacteria bacterium]